MIILQEHCFSQGNMEVVKLLLETNDLCRLELLAGSLIIDRNKQGVLDFYNDLSTYKTFGFICMSTQIGCPLKCKFCGNRRNIHKRNLSAYELREQFQLACEVSKRRLNSDLIREIQFGGTGEPLYNLDELYKFMSLVYNGNNYFLFPTTGFPRKDLMTFLNSDFIKEFPLFIQLSLHSSSSSQRKQILHIQDFDETISLFSEYKDKYRHPLLINYLIINDINDSEEDAKKLMCALESLKEIIVIKISKPNYTGSKYSYPSDEYKVRSFHKLLQVGGFTSVLFYSVGEEEMAGCGQLVSSQVK